MICNFWFRFGFVPKMTFYFRRIFVFGRKRISHLRSVSNRIVSYRAHIATVGIKGLTPYQRPSQ